MNESRSISTLPARRASDPGAPRIRPQAAVPVVLAAVAAVAAASTVGGTWGDLAVVGAALVVGEMLVIDLLEGPEVPLGDAVLLPLVAIASGPQYALVVAGAELLAAPASWNGSLPSLVRRLFERGSVAAGVYGAWYVVNALDPAQGDTLPLAPLTVAALATLVISRGMRSLRSSDPLNVGAPDAAWFATAATGVLMAIAVVGDHGRGAMGLWGIPIFAVPLLAARYAFGRLHAIRRTYDQTIGALSAVPEIGGRVRSGHARRVADLCGETGRALNLSRRTLVDLERAALLHALGHVTLDEPSQLGRPVRAAEVAQATVDVLEPDAGLQRPARLVAAMARPHGGDDPTTEEYLASHVLRAVAAFEEIAGGDPSRAETALGGVASGVPDVHDARVVTAMASVVVRRLDLTPRFTARRAAG